MKIEKIEQLSDYCDNCCNYGVEVKGFNICLDGLEDKIVMLCARCMKELKQQMDSVKIIDTG